MKVDIEVIEPQHYLYVEKTCNYEDLNDQISIALRLVQSFANVRSIKPLSTPMTVYPEPANWPSLTFRSGLIVSSDAAAKASDGIEAAILPGGYVAKTMHVGSHDTLPSAHREFWDYLKREGLVPEVPVWEVYIDDPKQVEVGRIRTELFRLVSLVHILT